VYLVSAGVLGLSTAGVQRVVVDASGNVGIGTASPARKLHVGASGSVYATIRNSTDNVNTTIGATTTDGWVGTESNHPLVIYTNSTERMRLDASGNLLVGITSKMGGGITGLDLNLGTNPGITFGASGVQKGFWYTYPAGSQLRCESAPGYTIAMSSGGVSGVVLTNGNNQWSPLSSDERKKKDFEPTQGLETILKIEPVKYRYITDDTERPKRLGFTAQNIATAIPEMAIPNGEKAEDGSDYLTIIPDYLLPVLVNAVKELKEKNDALEARLAALESK
jgi:hypothetical protein